MDFIKLKFELFVARLVFVVIKLFRLTGTTLAGYVLLKCFPDFLYLVNEKMNGIKITVSGTNGKTTTSGLISHFLEYDKKTVVNNLKGANLLVGITNSIAEAFVKNPNYLKKSPEYFVFETDEGHLQKLYVPIPCDYLVLTNLFNDQSDRFGSITTVCNMIKNAVSKNKDLISVLNSDDPITSDLAGESRTVYYGLESVEYCGKIKPKEGETSVFACPRCGKDLIYTNRFYAQQGHFECDCGYSRKLPDYSARVKIYDDYSELYLTHNSEERIYKLKSTELYNIYNTIAGISLASELGCRDIQGGLDTFKPIFGRSVTEIIDNHKTTIRLIKNPAGANTVMGTIDVDSDILLAFNDNTGDGHDISWLWDVDFGNLKEVKGKIVVSGTRAKDAILRLKYCEVPTDKIKLFENIDDSVNYIYQNSEGYIIILPNYTALYEIKKNKRFEKE